MQCAPPGACRAGIEARSGASATLRATASHSSYSRWISWSNATVKACWGRRRAYFGTDGVHVPAHRRRIGYVFQDARLFPHLDVRGNLDYGRRMNRLADDTAARKRVMDLLDIGELLDRRPGKLSGGERQRVAFGRALVARDRGSCCWTSRWACLTDLRERFARCEIQAGEPIVPYRETIVRAEEMKPPANKELGRGTVIATTTSKQVTSNSRPTSASRSDRILGKNATAIKRFYSDRQAAEKKTERSDPQDSSEQEDVDEDDLVDNSRILSLQEFKKQLSATFENVKGQREIWANAVEQITAFGPRRSGANLLIDTTKDCICGRL